MLNSGTPMTQFNYQFLVAEIVSRRQSQKTKYIDEFKIFFKMYLPKHTTSSLFDSIFFQFVAHPHCQQLLASIWYEGLPGFRRRHVAYKIAITVSLGILAPLWSLLYIVAPQSRVGFLKKPFIKFIVHSANYSIFLCTYFFLRHLLCMYHNANYSILLCMSLFLLDGNTGCYKESIAL